MTDRAEPGLREAAQAVLVEWDQQVASGAWMMVLPIPALRAALAATEPDGPTYATPAEVQAVLDHGLAIGAITPEAHAAIKVEPDGLDVAMWRSISAALDDELRRVEAGYSTPESMARARMTYARLAEQDRSGEPFDDEMAAAHNESVTDPYQDPKNFDENTRQHG